MMDKALYSLDQIAEMTDLSKTTVKTIVNRGEMLSIKVGKRRLVTAAALQHWIDDRTAEAEAQLQAAG
jgi:excisionase family DNA binding protein